MRALDHQFGIAEPAQAYAFVVAQRAHHLGLDVRFQQAAMTPHRAVWRRESDHIVIPKQRANRIAEPGFGMVGLAVELDARLLPRLANQGLQGVLLPLVFHSRWIPVFFIHGHLHRVSAFSHCGADFVTAGHFLAVDDRLLR